jgi:hypothetical protein
MSKRDKYILAAFVVCTLLQFWLLDRITYPRRVRDWSPPTSYYVFNVALAGAVLVAMATVLRVGRGWHWLVAPVLCICPVIFICDFCRWSIAELSRQ